MELNQLRCFLGVVETLHFGRAAERLYMSQPALSAQVKSLEQELGVQLFERSHAGTTLTYAGTIYRDEARQILAMGTRAVARARLASEGRIGRLRIGFISTAAAYVMPTLVSAFRKDYPDVELDLSHHLTTEQVNLLKQGMLDIGFVRLPLLHSPELSTILIHREPFKLFLPTAHPLAARADITLRDLDGAEFVTYSRSNAPGFAAALALSLKEAGIRPAATHEASDMYTLMLHVAAGFGIAIAPASLQNYRPSGVSIRDIAGIIPSEIALAHRTGLEHPAALAFIRSACAQIDQSIR